MGRRNGVRGTFSLATGKFARPEEGARREGGKEAEEGKKPGTGRDGHPGGNRSSSRLSRAGARGECRGPGPGVRGLGSAAALGPGLSVRPPPRGPGCSGPGAPGLGHIPGSGVRTSRQFVSA